MQPLSLNLNQVDTSMPQPLDGKYVATIESIKQEENKAKTGWNLIVEVKLNDDVPNNKGGNIKAGYKIRRYLPLPIEGTAYDGEHKEMFLQSLALFQLAVLGLKNTETNVANLPPFDDAFVAESCGKCVVVKLGMSKEKEGQESEFGPRSEIKAFLPIEE